MGQWKPIPGYEGFYEIADHGMIRRSSDSTRAKRGHIMKTILSRDGYEQIGLSRPGTRQSCRRVHRVVWESHVGPIPKGRVINHKNGNKRDNSLANLECVTNSENIRHAFQVLGRKRGGEKLDEKAVLVIRHGRARGITLKRLADYYGVSETCILSVASGRTWPHVGGPLTKPNTRHQNAVDVAKRITDDMVRSVIVRYRNGERAEGLAVEVGVNKRTIHNWIQGRARPRVLASIR